MADPWTLPLRPHQVRTRAPTRSLPPSGPDSCSAPSRVSLRGSPLSGNILDSKKNPPISNPVPATLCHGRKCPWAICRNLTRLSASVLPSPRGWVGASGGRSGVRVGRPVKIREHRSWRAGASRGSEKGVSERAQRASSPFSRGAVPAQPRTIANLNREAVAHPRPTGPRKPAPGTFGTGRSRI